MISRTRRKIVVFVAFGLVIALPSVLFVHRLAGPPPAPDGLTGKHIERKYEGLFERLGQFPNTDEGVYERLQKEVLAYIGDDESIVRLELRGGGRVFLFDRGNHTEYNCFGKDVLGCEINPSSLFPVKSVMYKKRFEETYVANLYISYDHAEMLAITNLTESTQS